MFSENDVNEANGKEWYSMRNAKELEENEDEEAARCLLALTTSNAA